VSKHWYENTMVISTEHVLTAEVLLRAMMISAGQGASAEDMGAWNEERVLREIEYHLVDYGAKLTPRWFKESGEWSVAASVAARSSALLGTRVRIDAEMDHFGAITMLEAWLEEACGLRLSRQTVQAMSGLSNGAHFVRVPEGDFGFAEAPTDLTRFDASLHERVHGIARPQLDEIMVGMLHRGGMFWSARTFNAKLIRLVVEELVQAHYPEIARCTGLGRFHVKKGAGPADVFCHYVCDAHLAGREEQVGPIFLSDDRDDYVPRRCGFSRSIPFLGREDTSKP